MRSAALLLIIGLGGCAAEPPAPLAARPSALEDVYWRLAEFDGAPVEPEVSATFRDGRLEGVAPCNRYFGAYVLEQPATLGVGAVAATRRTCPKQALELRYFGALTEVARYEIERGELRLLDAEANVLMRFGA